MVEIEVKTKVRRILGRCFLELPRRLCNYLEDVKEVPVVLLLQTKQKPPSGMGRSLRILTEPKFKRVYSIEFTVSQIKDGEEMDWWLLPFLRHLKDNVYGLGYKKQTIVKEKDYFKAVYVKGQNNKVIVEAKREFPVSTIWKVVITQEIITEGPLTAVQELTSLIL